MALRRYYQVTRAWMSEAGLALSIRKYALFDQPVSLNTPSVLFPYITVLLPPATHQVTADVDVGSARITGHDVMPV